MKTQKKIPIDQYSEKNRVEYVSGSPFPKWLFFGIAGVLLIFLGIIFILTLSTQGTVSRLETELNNRNEKIDVLRQSLFLLASDYNTLRISLGLEPQDISLLLAEFQDEKKEKQGSLFEQGIEVLHGRYLDELYGKKVLEMRESDSFKAFQAESGYTFQDMGGLSGVLKNGIDVVFRITFFPDDGKISIRTVGDLGKYDGICDNSLVAFGKELQPKLLKFIKDRELQKWRFRTLTQDDVILSLLKSKNAEFVLQSETESRLNAVLQKNSTHVASLYYDKFQNNFYIDNDKIEDFSGFRLQLTELIENIDSRSTTEQELDAITFALEKGLDDKAFKKMLDDLDLTVQHEPREDDRYFYYDVFTKGERIGAFAIDKKGASIFLVDRDDITIRSLHSFSGSDAGKIRNMNSEVSFSSEEIDPKEENKFHFLLFGMNEEMSDTIILVTGDTEEKTISFLSIPRDLYFNSQRVNLLPKQGMEYCVKTISEITGIPVTKYAAVDLFAFIDVIDLLGGINVQLNEPVIDPTYKIKENGQWKTLAYSVGSHHMNGTQAMRIIRSRHTSSDFSRAYRQQLVLESLLEAFKNRSSDDQNVALELFKVLIKYVDTNMSIIDLANYYLKLKDCKVASRHVISTNNILYASYSNLYLLNEKQQELLMDTLGEEERGGYILLPKNKDWLFFKIYVQQIVYKQK